MRLDVTDEENWQQVIDATVATYGKLDVVVNNAGISGRTTVEETAAETWDRVMAVNGKGVFLGTKLAIPELAAGRRRVDYQHFVHLRDCGQRDIRRLPCFQGGGTDIHQVGGHSVRRRGDKGELGASGVCGTVQ